MNEPFLIAFFADNFARLNNNILYSVESFDPFVEFSECVLECFFIYDDSMLIQGFSPAFKLGLEEQYPFLGIWEDREDLWENFPERYKAHI